MILQHHDMMNIEDRQNLLPLVLSLNTPFVLLYLLYMGRKQHNLCLHMSPDILHCQAFQSFFLEKYHSHHHQYTFSVISIYIFIIKFCTMMYKVKKY